MLPAQARLHAAASTASPKATIARKPDQDVAPGAREVTAEATARPRTLRWRIQRTWGGSCAQTSQLRGLDSSGYHWRTMTELLKTLTRSRLRPGRHARAGRRLRQGPSPPTSGFDPTADSLHVGNLVPVMGLAWLQRFGHTPIVLVGGGTGMVGDPSGKRAERPMLALEQIERNAGAIARQLARFLVFEGNQRRPAAEQRRLAAALPLMEFLRDAGKHFTLGYMLQKDRCGAGWRPASPTPSSPTCWSRPTTSGICSGPSSCELQIGGSDQWGNITAGIELIGRREGKQAHGLVFPLITTASGAKFGKSEAGNVWLDPAKTSPYQFYQFWINTDDRDVERYLKLFTFLPLEQIAAAMAEHGARSRTAHRAAAAGPRGHARVHGAAAAEQAVTTSAALFGGGARPERSSPDMPDPSEVARSSCRNAPMVELLVASGLASSKADARRGSRGKAFTSTTSQSRRRAPHRRGLTCRARPRADS